MMRRALAGSLSVMFLTLWQSAASAETAPPTPIRACLESFERGQLAERRGSFLAAREELARCMAPACPAKLQAECAPLLDEIRRRLPSAILVCAEPTASLSSASDVLVDGSSQPANGRAFELDPGEHVFVLRSDRAPEIVRRVIVEGTKGQRVALRCVADPPRSRPVAAMVALASTGAVGLGTFAYFGVNGLAARAKLDDCRGQCSDADVDRVQRRFLIADVGLGVALAAGLVAALTWWSSTPSSTRPAGSSLAPGIVSF